MRKILWIEQRGQKIQGERQSAKERHRNRIRTESLPNYLPFEFQLNELLPNSDTIDRMAHQN